MTTTALVPAQLAGGLVIEPGNPEFEATCAEMARQFEESVAAIRAAAGVMKTACERLYEAFKGEIDSGNPFDVNISHSYARSYRSDVTEIVKAFTRSAWRMLADRIGVKKVMSVKKREEFEKQLESGDLPEITEQAIVGVILGMVGQAEDFAKEAAREVFEILRPGQRHWGSQYKTNSAFKVGRRVILSWYVEGSPRGGFRPNYNREKELIAIDGVFHLLDGKGVMKDRRGPLIEAINACVDGKGETEFFSFRCFRNRNLHLTFKRLDLVKQLNGLGMGSYELGEDAE